MQVQPTARHSRPAFAMPVERGERRDALLELNCVDGAVVQPGAHPGRAGPVGCGVRVDGRCRVDGAPIEWCEPFGVVGMFAVFNALVSGMAGVSLFNLGAMLNYLVSLCGHTPRESMACRWSSRQSRSASRR